MSWDTVVYAVGAAHLIVYMTIGGLLFIVWAGSQIIEWALPRFNLKREFLAFAVERYRRRHKDEVIE
ncbi:hypothetical protein IHQ56_14285 [Methylobacillus flagellatus]|uniref:hypothetical protein n=1 Tax=Methylobacillus flagellatus TaxID=405 RepID=UPI002853F55E|nr:hypothetical protein [Methylobacillus flagellatus]MDR5172977.1 hypothetical protein [Methylobacillus flagellatus]